MTAPVKYGDHEKASLNPKCLACGVISPKPVTDHCHKHGWVRGVLCPNCNALMALIDRMIIPGPAMIDRGVSVDDLIGHAARCHECDPVLRDDLRRRVPKAKTGTEWNIRFPDDVLTGLKKAAAEDTRSLNGEVVAICRAHLTARGLLPPAEATTE